MSSPSSQAPNPDGWLTLALIAQMALGLLAMTIGVPSMQDWPATFGASQARVQLTFSAFVATFGLLQLVHGPLSDRIGRKPVLMAGLALTLLGSILGSVAPDLATLIVARALQGAGAAAGMVVGRAMVQDLFTGPHRTRMMAIVGMTMGVCPPTALLLGGQLHVRLGWQANFVLIGGLAAALMAFSWRHLPRAAPAPRDPRDPHAHGWRELAGGYARLLREPAFLGYVAILASGTATFYAYLAGAPVVLKHYGITPDRLGLYIMCTPLAYIAGNVLTTRLIGRMGERGLMNLGQGLSMLGLVIVLALALADVDTALALALPLILLGIGQGLLIPPVLAGTVGIVPALAGSAAAVAGVMQQAGGAIGGFFVGLVPHDGAVNLALMMIGWMVLGLVAQLVLLRRRLA